MDNQIRNCLAIFNLSNVIKEPTRISVNSSTLMDPIIVRDECQFPESRTITVDNCIRHHKATNVSMKTQTSLDESYVREVWYYKNANFDELNGKIRTFNWNDVITDSFSADEACNNFTEFYVDLCKSCNSRKKVGVRPSDRPWFTSKLRHNIRIRDRLRHKALKSNFESDIERFKAQRNKVNNMKKFAKETFMNNYGDVILGQNCGCKSFWQLMGRLAGKESKTSDISPL